ncbi:cysteine proteinase [Daldinia caldariorum]|uniref:cysteine proteinase n=1 Tax=Daldinia caldariorum TaxID=326644 RepID=UPI002007CB22|nr:cysteine proteinase [Daldinia caldariorum]KAI1468037.1 cysteine proteinase [Daldinia caldariorum]
MESLETIQARHRKEQRDLQARITNKKKNATKKTRKGVNDECAELERQLKERQEQELAALNGEVDNEEGTTGEIEEQEDEKPNGASRKDATDGIAEQLDRTNLSQSPEPNSATTQPPPLPPQQQQQPKKRNRQKERMARRAAEQEAAAAAAEQEAANMTDHRKIEKTYLLKEFQANNLVEKEIQPDGHCLFSAVADQLEARGVPLSLGLGLGEKANPETGTEREVKGLPAYRVVRRVATDYMSAHADDFAPFLEEPLDTYVRKIRDTAEWGGQLELSALANAYGVEIKVLQDGRTETIEPNPSGAAGKKEERGEERKRIWLAYYRHGYGLGEHYNSLRQAD